MLLIIGVIVLLTITECVLFSKELYWISLLMFIGSIVGAVWFYDIWTLHTLKEWTTYLGLYLTAGVGVGILKWFHHIAKTGTKIRDIKDNFNFKATITPGTNIWYQFCRQVNDSARNKIRNSYGEVDSYETAITALTPRARNFKEEITFWILQWPITLVSFVLEDFLLKIGRWVAEIFDTIFASLGKKITELSIGKIDI